MILKQNTVAAGLNHKVFLGKRVNLKKTSVTGSTKLLKNSSCGLIDIIRHYLNQGNNQ